MRGHADKSVINLASNEYFSVVDLKTLKAPVITPVFKEEKDGKLRQLQFFAKRARGLMARWAVQNRIDQADQLKDFDTDGYTLNKRNHKVTILLDGTPGSGNDDCSVVWEIKSGLYDIANLNAERYVATPWNGLCLVTTP